MKKPQTMVLALLTVSALSMIFTVFASAETTPAEWLANGNSVTVNLTSETTGSLLLEDTKSPGPDAVLCNLILAGTVGIEGKDEITEILNLAKEKIEVLGGLALLGTGAGTDCVREKTCEEGTAAKPL